MFISNRSLAHFLSFIHSFIFFLSLWSVWRGRGYFFFSFHFLPLILPDKRSLSFDQANVTYSSGLRWNIRLKFSRIKQQRSAVSFLSFNPQKRWLTDNGTGIYVFHFQKNVKAPTRKLIFSLFLPFFFFFFFVLFL